VAGENAILSLGDGSKGEGRPGKGTAFSIRVLLGRIHFFARTEGNAQGILIKKDGLNDSSMREYFTFKFEDP